MSAIKVEDSNKNPETKLEVEKVENERNLRPKKPYSKEMSAIKVEDLNKNPETKLGVEKVENERNLRPKKPCSKEKQCICCECSVVTKVTNGHPKKKTDKQTIPFKINEFMKSVRFTCNTCNYSTDSKTSFLSHQQIHLIVKGYKCEKCDFRTALRYDLVVHQRMHAGSAYKKFRCRYCLYYTDSRKAILQHQAKIHKCGKVSNENENTLDMVRKLFRPCFVRLTRLTQEEIKIYQLNIPRYDFSKLPLTLRRRQSFSSSSSSGNEITDEDNRKTLVKRYSMFRRNKMKRFKCKYVKPKPKTTDKDFKETSTSASSSSESETTSSSSSSSGPNQFDFYSDLKKALAQSKLLVNGNKKITKHLNGMVRLTPKSAALEESSSDSSSENEISSSSETLSSGPGSKDITSNTNANKPNSTSKDSALRSSNAKKPSSTSKDGSTCSSIPKSTVTLGPILQATNCSSPSILKRNNRLGPILQDVKTSSISQNCAPSRSSSGECTEFSSILHLTPSFGTMKKETSPPISRLRKRRLKDGTKLSSISITPSSTSEEITQPLLPPHKIKREVESPVADSFLGLEYNSMQPPGYIVNSDLGELLGQCSGETITADNLEENEPLGLLEPKTEPELRFINEPELRPITELGLKNGSELRPNTVYQLQVIKKEPLDY